MSKPRAIGQQVPQKKRIDIVIRLGVTLLLLAVLFKSVSWSALWETLTHVDQISMLLGLAIGSLGLLVSSYQWRSLLRAEHISLDIVRLLKLYVVGIAFSHFLPTNIGGDAVKALYVGREAGDGAGATSAVIMSRLTGLFGMLLVAFPALVLWYTHFTTTVLLWFVLLSLGVAGMICGAIYAAMMLPRLLKGKLINSRLVHYRIFTLALRIGNALAASARRPRSLCVATLFGILFWITACLNYYSYAAALRMNVPLYFYFVAIPFVSLVTLLPISINGFGVRESAFVYIFSTIHTPVAISLLLAFLMDVQVLFFGAIGGYFYLTMGNKGIKPSVQVDAARPMMNDYHQPTSQSNTHAPPETTLQELSTGSGMPSPVSESLLPQEPKGQSPPVQPEPEGQHSSRPPDPPVATHRRVFSGVLRQKWLAGVIAVMLCGIAALGAIGFYQTTQATPNVTLYQVGVQNVSHYIGGGGIVFPRQQIDLSYPAAERVVAVLVQAGDQVTLNEPLIRLDAGHLNAEIAQAADDLAAAKVYLDDVSATGNAVTVAQAQQAYNLAKNKYDALVAESTSPLLHNDTLVSPMNGIVTAVNINTGETFTANTPLLTIMDESTVTVHVKIPLSDLGQVSAGLPALVTPSALPNHDFQGVVTSIIPKADPQTDTFEVWIRVANTERMLLPGMSAFARIQVSGQALEVPRLAVLNPDRESIVFVVQHEHAYIQHVHIVGRSIDAIFLDAGIRAGDKVVLAGADRLQNGQRVRVKSIEGQTT